QQVVRPVGLALLAHRSQRIDTACALPILEGRDVAEAWVTVVAAQFEAPPAVSSAPPAAAGPHAVYWIDQPPSLGKMTPLMLTPSSESRNVIEAAICSAVAIVGI